MPAAACTMPAAAFTSVPHISLTRRGMRPSMYMLSCMAECKAHCSALGIQTKKQVVSAKRHSGATQPERSPSGPGRRGGGGGDSNVTPLT